MAATFDYVIVGGGSTGSVLANRLSENGKHTVLVLEAGEDERWFWTRVPAGVAHVMTSGRAMWHYQTQEGAGIGGRSLFYPSGKALGGSGVINGMIWVRGDPAEYDNWARMGNPGWSYQDLLPLAKRMESYALGDPRFRGRHGPMTISQYADRDTLSEGYIAAAAASGVPRNEDFSGQTYQGIGYLQYNTRKGWRRHSADAYLRPALHRWNLSVETGATVERILLEGQRATGVAYRKNGASRTVRANKEVLLCAGAVHSPRLLELSGIGRPEILRKAGIPVVHPLPGVGENLTDHIYVRLGFSTDVRTTFNSTLRSPLAMAKMGLRWLLFGRGPMACSTGSVMALASTDPDGSRPDVKIQLLQLSLPTTTASRGHFSANASARNIADRMGIDPFPGFSIIVCPLRPESRGSIHITSADPCSTPAIDLNFLSDERDIKTMLAGLHLVRKITRHPNLARHIVQELRPGPDVQTDAGLLDWIRATGMSGFHPVGTCRMGTDGDAVVDPRLRVHGLQGLRVCDASIMPTIVSANTHAPTILIGEKGAELILQDAEG